jgi:hypothetical protein
MNGLPRFSAARQNLNAGRAQASMGVVIGAAAGEGFCTAHKSFSSLLAAIEAAVRAEI